MDIVNVTKELNERLNFLSNTVVYVRAWIVVISIVLALTIGIVGAYMYKPSRIQEKSIQNPTLRQELTGVEIIGT